MISTHNLDTYVDHVVSLPHTCSQTYAFFIWDVVILPPQFFFSCHYKVTLAPCPILSERWVNLIRTQYNPEVSIIYWDSNKEGRIFYLWLLWEKIYFFCTLQRREFFARPRTVEPQGPTVHFLGRTVGPQTIGIWGRGPNCPSPTVHFLGPESWAPGSLELGRLGVSERTNVVLGNHVWKMEKNNRITRHTALREILCDW